MKLQSGQAYTEYALIVMLIGIVVIGALVLMGAAVWQLFHNVTHAMPQ